MALFLPLVAVATAGVALLLAAVSVLAARRTRSLRFVFAALAFAFFFARSLLVVLDGAGWLASPLPWNGWSVGADALTLALLYLAIVKE